MCKKLDPCFLGLLWWEKNFGKSRPMILDTAEVPGWFDKYIPAVSFDLKWPAWFLRQLIDKMIDQMDINYERYSKECKRLYAVCKVFEREAAKAARDNTLSQVTMKARVEAAIVLCQTMIVTYKKL